MKPRGPNPATEHPALIAFPGRGHGLKFVGGKLPFHPLADLFPLLEGDDLAALKDDIARNGLEEPITLFDGQVLDGRNRFLACHAVSFERGWPDSGFEPPVRFVQFNGADPAAFVISKNLHRRHLNESQRAMAAAKLATLPLGANQHAQICAPSQNDAADMLNVSRRAVQSAKKVRASGSPALIKAVDDGKIAVSVGAQLAELPKAAQAKAVKNPDDARHFAKIYRRREREQKLAGKILALPEKRYGVILADPEWRFQPYSRDTGMDRAADNHYPTSVTEEIKARDVASIAAEDCVLFLWATVPMLTDALEVMKAWGFKYKSHFIWAKDRFGTGYWNRNRHELLLVGTRGDIPAPSQGTQFNSLIEAPVGEHSEKPAFAHEIVERHFPTLPKIELNARKGRAGWEAWGFEAPAAE